MGVLVVAAAVVVAPDNLAHGAVVGIGQERVHRGARVGDRPLALVAVVGGGLGRGGLQVFRQAAELVGLEVGDPAGLLGLQVLAELGEQGGQPLVDLGDPGLGLGVEGGAGAGEVVPVDPDQPLLLGRQLLGGGVGLQRLDAGEQLGVLHDLVVEGRQLGVHLVLDLLVLRRRQVGAPDAVDRLRPGQRLAAAFQRLDGVGEGGRRGVVGDGLDLAPVQRHGLFQRRLEVGHLDQVEPRIAAVGAAPGGEHGVLVGLGLHAGGLGGGFGRRGGDREREQRGGADADEEELTDQGRSSGFRGDGGLAAIAVVLGP